MAGPDGGDGGRGGHIILRGNSQLWTLLHLRYYKNVIAENGEGGSGTLCTGKNGKDIIIEVPLGTIAKDEETGARDAEVLEDGQEVIWVRGGRGGLGNAHFATATNQAPEYAQPGEPGKEGWKVLERKIQKYRPQLVALIGVTLYRAILPLLGSPRPLPKNYPVELGAQSERIHGARIFVLPNPSGRNANFTYAEMLEAFRKVERESRGLKRS